MTDMDLVVGFKLGFWIALLLLDFIVIYLYYIDEFLKRRQMAKFLVESRMLDTFQMWKDEKKRARKDAIRIENNKKILKAGGFP